MILLFNHIPVTLQGKINAFISKVKSAYGSEFYNIQGKYWKGDKLTIESLFPDWLVKEYKDDPSNVLIVTIIKNWLRWLMSTEYGYGAQPEWKNIRNPLLLDSTMLEALAEYYFPGADFNSEALLPILPNIRNFGVKADSHYFDCKGTASAIKYVLVTLMDMNYSTTIVNYTSPGIITITGNVDDNYKTFLNEHVYPAGTIVNYVSV